VLADKFLNMQKHYEGFFNCAITYNEKLAHQFYAGADFLVMPSRVEPCGLNQLYAYRYGTVPIVRNTGGLSDTVVDFGFHNGTGLKFDNFSVEDVLIAFYRASQLATDSKAMNNLRERIMQLDFSWQKSSQLYRNVYQKFLS
jgi:starch synthase